MTLSALKPVAGVPVDHLARISAASGSFAGYGLSEGLVRALARRGLHRLPPLQSLTLADALAGRDVLARSPASAVNTLAFAVPITERLLRQGHASALVLVPSRTHAGQVAEVFRDIAATNGLSVATVHGGIGIAGQVRAATRADILIATPRLLVNLLRRRLLRVNEVRICVLDEADRMLELGFLQDLSTILSVLPDERQTMLFSATLGGKVGDLAVQFTKGAVRHELQEPRHAASPSFAAPWPAVRRQAAVPAPGTAPDRRVLLEPNGASTASPRASSPMTPLGCGPPGSAGSAVPSLPPPELVGAAAKERRETHRRGAGQTGRGT